MVTLPPASTLRFPAPWLLAFSPIVMAVLV